MFDDDLKRFLMIHFYCGSLYLFLCFADIFSFLLTVKCYLNFSGESLIFLLVGVHNAFSIIEGDNTETIFEVPGQIEDIRSFGLELTRAAAMKYLGGEVHYVFYN